MKELLPPPQVTRPSENGHKPQFPVSTEVFQAPKPEGRRPAPVIDSLRTIQYVQDQFREWAVPDESPDFIMKAVKEETDELEEAIQSGNRREVASELPDVFLQLCRLFNYYQIPMDIAISDKMARNAEKYNPAVIKMMREQEGKGTVAAMGELKQQWDKTRDFSDEFCRSCGRPS